MTVITPTNAGVHYNFNEMHDAIQKYIEDELLAGAISVVLKNNEVVDLKMWGHMDIESQRPMEEDAIFRIYSNTKIITSVAALCLWEDGCFELDDPIEKYLPELANLQVLKPGATEVSDTEPLKSKPTVRQLMCHNAGFSYGIFLESPVDKLYTDQGILTLEHMTKQLAGIPLAYQPGTRWQYSVSTDILARLIEVWSGNTFYDCLNNRIFTPLGMKDTHFHVTPDKHHRLASNYAPVNLLDPMESGLKLAPDQLLGSYLEPKPFHSGGGGLTSTISDYTRFFQMLIGKGTIGGVRILKESTVTMMHSNQLPDGIAVQLPNWLMPDTLFGLGVAIKTAPAKGEPEHAVDEYHWGGLAGTHSWIAPRADLSGLIFTQRLPGFWHPFSHDFKRHVYQAAAD